MRVLDLSRVLAGPYCGMMLADMGADVIKIERPQVGDDSRRMPPIRDGESFYFMNLNRNKRSMTLDLKSASGKKVFLDLVRKSDIVIENYRPGVMDRLGLGYEQLREVNPAIIYGCVSGFGHYGPYKDRPGYDIIGQAMSGLMSTTGWPDSAPTRSGTAISDVMGGISMCVGVLAAYVSRLNTGVGQKVDISLVDSMVSALEIINQIYLATGRLPTRIGNRYESAYPYDSFQTKDGYMVIGAGNDKLFRLLCQVMGQPELEQDPRFSSNMNRIEHNKELKVILEDWLSAYSTKEAVDTILAAGVPAAPIYNIKDVTEDPHIAGAREMFVTMNHPTIGEMKITGNQVKLSGTPVEYHSPAPLLGQHTAEILQDILGMDKETMEAYRQQGTF